MNRRDDPAADAATLASYLEGRDGVSAAYGASSAELPPQALDLRILRAARTSLQPDLPAPAKPAIRNYHAVAASLLLGMLLGIVLFPDDGEAPAAATAVSEPIESTATDALATTARSIAEDARDDIPAGSSGFRERTLPEPLPPIVTRNVITTSISPFRSEAAAVFAAGQDDDVAGSRSVIDLGYRDDQDQWLREIARLNAMLQETSEDRDQLRRMLELERAEFRAEHPDIDLDQAMQRLQ